MADGEKIYVGNGKEHVFPDGGRQVKIRLSLQDMEAHFEKYGWTTDAGKMYINLILSERREVDQYGNTHNLTIDTWKPQNASQSTQGASNGNGYQKREQSPSKPLSGSANGVPDFEDDDFAPDGVPVF